MTVRELEDRISKRPDRNAILATAEAIQSIVAEAGAEAGTYAVVLVQARLDQLMETARQLNRKGGE